MILNSTLMQEIGPSAIRSITSKNAQKAAEGIYVTNFAGGRPDAALFPYTELKEITNMIFSTEDANSVQYGPSSGYMPLRNEIAELMKQMQVNAAAENIYISAGAGQAISFISRALLSDENKVVVCENPTYVASIDTFRAFRADVIGIDMEADGMNLDQLEAVLKTRKVQFIYTIPDFQNPTGTTMSLQKRKRLVELAQMYNTVIVEDAPYAMIHFEGEIMPAIKSFDKYDRVIYIGSFSKIVCPGLRVGWIVADRESVQKLIYMRMRDDSFCNTLAERQIFHYLHDYDFESHLLKIRKAYKSRKDAMIQAIRSDFPERTEVIEPNGGLFAWINLPPEIDAMEFFEAGFEKNIAVVPGRFFHTDGGGNGTVRLCFATVEEPEILEKVSELGKILKKLMDTKKREV